MRKLLASALLLAFSSATVLAADFPMKAPMAAPVSVFSWTGCYVGAHAGGGSMHDSLTQDNNFATGPFDTSGNNGTGSGAVAGGQLGCNYQDGNAVFGLEGEGYWSSLKTTTGTSFNETGNADGAFNFAATTKNKDDFTIAARVGVAFERTLVYGKAGWVSGNFSFGSVETFTALQQAALVASPIQSLRPRRSMACCLAPASSMRLPQTGPSNWNTTFWTSVRGLRALTNVSQVVPAPSRGPLPSTPPSRSSRWGSITCSTRGVPPWLRDTDPSLASSSKAPAAPGLFVWAASWSGRVG